LVVLRLLILRSAGRKGVSRTVAIGIERGARWLPWGVIAEQLFFDGRCRDCLSQTAVTRTGHSTPVLATTAFAIEKRRIPTIDSAIGLESPWGRWVGERLPAAVELGGRAETADPNRLAQGECSTRAVRDPFAQHRLDALSQRTAGQNPMQRVTRIGFGLNGIGCVGVFDFGERWPVRLPGGLRWHSNFGLLFRIPEQQRWTSFAKATPVRFPDRIRIGVGGNDCSIFGSVSGAMMTGAEVRRLPTHPLQRFHRPKCRLRTQLGNVERRGKRNFRQVF